MSDHDWLAERFEDHRDHLAAVAYRMLGSSSEAEDAVQETWLRLSRTDTGDVQNLGGWLTTVTGRVCLDMLRSRKSRREEPPSAHLPDEPRAEGPDPEHEAMMADSVGLALQVVLDTLTPAERLAFVLHDLFDLPFDEIAPIVDRSPGAAKMLASRARRRVQGADAGQSPDLARRREVVSAFLAASRDGDFDALVAMLDPDAVLRGDRPMVQMGAAAEVRGAAEVAGTFSGRARAARLALVDGSAGAVWAQGGEPRVVFGFSIEDGKITGIEMIADPDRLGQLDLVYLPA